MNWDEAIRKRLECSSPLIAQLKNDEIQHRLQANKTLLQGQYHGVAIDLAESVDVVSAILTCLASNVPLLPLESSWPNSRKQALIEQSGVGAVWDERGIHSTKSAAVFDLPIAYFMGTSGTTGSPKVVAIGQASLENFARWVSTYFTGVSPADVQLCVTSHCFDVFFAELFLAIFRKSTLVMSQFTRQRDFFVLVSEIGKIQPTVLTTVPYVAQQLLKIASQKRVCLDSLKSLILAGSRVSSSLVTDITRAIPGLKSLYNCYGPTEATVYVTAAQVLGGPLSQQTVTVGKSLPGVRLILVDEQNSPIRTPYCRGALVIEGQQLMLGYCEHGKILPVEDSFCVGDIGFFDKENNWYIEGRTDDTIKRRGARINLSEIDALVESLAGVSSAKALSEGVGDFEYRVKLVVVSQLSKEVLWEKLSSVLLPHQMPDSLEVVETMPVTTSGKICTRSLNSKNESLVSS